MSTVISSGSIPRALQLGINKIIETGTKQWAPIYPKLYDVLKSNSAYEVDVQMEGFGLASEKREGDDITFDSKRQGFSPKYQHTAYGKGFVWTREAKDDEKYGLAYKGARSLLRAMQVTKEVRAHVLYNTSFSTSSAMTGGDGVEVYDITGPKPRLFKKIPTGKGAHAFRALGDKRHVFVSNRVSNSISQIDFIDWRVVAQLPGPSGPDCMDITADGRLILVTSRWSRKLSVIDIASRKLLRQVPVGKSPHGVWTLDHAPRN